MGKEEEEYVSFLFSISCLSLFAFSFSLFFVSLSLFLPLSFLSLSFAFAFLFSLFFHCSLVPFPLFFSLACLPFSVFLFSLVFRTPSGVRGTTNTQDRVFKLEVLETKLNNVYRSTYTHENFRQHRLRVVLVVAWCHCNTTSCLQDVHDGIYKNNGHGSKKRHSDIFVRPVDIEHAEFG